MTFITGLKLSLTFYALGVVSAIAAACCSWAFWMKKKYQIVKRGK